MHTSHPLPTNRLEDLSMLLSSPTTLPAHFPFTACSQSICILYMYLPPHPPFPARKPECREVGIPSFLSAAPSVLSSVPGTPLTEWMDLSFYRCPFCRLLSWSSLFSGQHLSTSYQVLKTKHTRGPRLKHLMKEHPEQNTPNTQTSCLRPPGSARD